MTGVQTCAPSDLNMINVSIYTIFALIINGMILSLMIQLRSQSCNCISDWRNTFIIVYTCIIIAITLVRPFYLMLSPSSKYLYHGSNLLSVIISLAMLVNLYCLYTYTRDVDESSCDCVVGKSRDLFGFIYYMTRLSVALILISILVIIGVSLYLA